MKLTADARVAYPLDLVYRTYRDELTELLPYLPNVGSIEVKERVEAPDGDENLVRLHNVWRGKASIPKLAQGFIKPEMLSWDDHATWDNSTHSCSWKTVPHFFTERTTCSGTTRLFADGEQTRMEIRGDFALDLKGMKGVPRMMTKAATATAEKFIVALLAPNLASISKGLDAYLRTKA
jgi:hypothetical protein